MMDRDKKIAVLVFNEMGIDFRGIYSDDKDAERIALMNVHKGDVILATFKQTISPTSPKERGIFMSEPEIKIIPYNYVGEIQ